MAVRSGFFDAVDHDRLYNAEDVGSLLDGIVSDGILNSYGAHFLVTHTSGLEIRVGSGRGWFKNTWILNDDNLTLTANPNTSGVARIDTVVIDVNKTDDVRANTILIIQGTSSQPALINEAAHKQYPIANLIIDASGNNISSVVDRRNETYATSPLFAKPYYPVGSIYMSVRNENPAALFGGIWEQISGRFLIGCGGNSGFSNGDEGGSWYHTITANELPAHTHSIDLATQGATAEITTSYMSGSKGASDHAQNYGVSFMSWPWSHSGLPSLELDNYCPASWNYPYGFQGVGAADQEPNVGPSPYATTQVYINQSAHYHSVNGNTGSSGNGNAMELKPPYLAVYMWKRVS